MKFNRESPVVSMSTNHFSTKMPRTHIRERTVSSINGIRKAYVHTQNETGPLSLTIYKIQLKLDWKFKWKTSKLWNCWGIYLLPLVWTGIFWIRPQNTNDKRKIRQIVLHETKRFLHSNRNNHQSNKTTWSILVVNKHSAHQETMAHMPNPEDKLFKVVNWACYAGHW